MKEFVKYIFLFLVLLVIGALILHECSPQPPTKHDSTDSLKTVIMGLISDKEALKKLADRKDSVRIEYRTRWRERSGGAVANIDSIPCDSLRPLVINLVNSCDSVIAADSAQIAVLKQVITADSTIISMQGKVIQADSVKIATLQKEVKKQKRQKRWLIAALAAALGIAIVK